MRLNFSYWNYLYLGIVIGIAKSSPFVDHFNPRLFCQLAPKPSIYFYILLEDSCKASWVQVSVELLASRARSMKTSSVGLAILDLRVATWVWSLAAWAAEASAQMILVLYSAAILIERLTELWSKTCTAFPISSWPVFIKQGRAAQKREERVLMGVNSELRVSKTVTRVFT